MKNLIKNIILFACFLIVPTTLALCQPAKNPINWQFSLQWEKIALSEVPLPDTRIKIIDGYANVSFLFYKSDLSDEVLLSAEGSIEQGKIYVRQWDEEISEISGDFIIKDNQLKVSPLKGKFKNTGFDAEVIIELVSPYPFDAKVKAKGVMLEELSSFLPFLKDYVALKSPAEAQFNVQGVLPAGPIEFEAIFQEIFLYSVLMSDMKVSFGWSDNKIILKKFSANLDEGKISGEGELILNQK